jgi:hypothetical protein
MLHLCNPSGVVDSSISDRAGRFHIADIVEPDNLPRLFSSARLLSQAELITRRFDFVRHEEDARAYDRVGSHKRGDCDLSEHVSRFSKPTRDVQLEITASRRPMWFVLANEYRFSIGEGTGDLIFVAITPEFLSQLRSCADRLALLRPITPPLEGIPRGVSRALDRYRSQLAGSVAPTSGVGPQDASVATVKRHVAACSVAHGASVALCSTSAADMLADRSDTQKLLTTWSYIPLPMTPEHASAVRSLTKCMAGCLLMLEVVRICAVLLEVW